MFPTKKLKKRIVHVVEFISPYFAEFLGSLVMAVAYACNERNDSSDVLQPLSVGYAVIIATYSVAGISGGHLSPMVSLALGLLRKETWQKCVLYSIMHILATSIAGLIFSHTFSEMVHIGPRKGFEWRSVAFVEIYFPLVFVFVMLNSIACRRNLGYYSSSTDRNQFFAIASGLAYNAGASASIKISGALFNPGLALSAFIIARRSVALWYVLFHVIAVLGAVLLFVIVRPEECPSSWCSWRRKNEAQARDEDNEAEEGGGHGAETLLEEAEEEEVAEDDIATVVTFVTLGEHDLASSEPPYSLRLRLLSEFIGTHAVCTFVCVNLAASTRTFGWSVGTGLIAMVYALATVSGAHFNPAVTLAVILSGRGYLSPWEGGLYVSTQILAGLIAGMMCVLFVISGGNWAGLTTTPARPLMDRITVLLAEGVFTMGVGLVTLTTLTSRTLWRPRFRPPRNFQFALAIGLAYVGAVTALRKITGGELNPAVSCTTSMTHLLDAHFQPRPKQVELLTYILAQAAGGTAASLAFRIMNPQEYMPDPLSSRTST